MSGFSPDQLNLLQCVAASLQPETQKAAEKQLDQYATQYPGYASLLLSLLHPSIAASIGGRNQLLCGVLFKQYVEKHWVASDDKFEPPVVSDPEKQHIHANILEALATESVKVRRQVALAIGSIAEHDFPERWPALLPNVIAILNQAANMAGEATTAQSNLLNGCMQALEDFCSAMDDQQLVSTLPQLFPALLQLCEKQFGLIMQLQQQPTMPQLTPQQTEAVKDAVQFCIYALQIYQSCCESLRNMNELVNQEGGNAKERKASVNFNKVLAEFFLPSLQHWFAFVSSVLTMPSSPGVFSFAMAFPTSWGLRMEAVKAILHVGEMFEDQLLARGVEGTKMYENIMSILLDTMTNLFPMYERRVLNAPLDGEEAQDNIEAEDEDTIDEDGNAINSSMFLFESFAYFKSVLRIHKPRPPKKVPNKNKKQGLTAVSDLKQQGFEHLRSLFGHTPNSFLPRLLQLILQYGQLSTPEIQKSLGGIEDFLSFQDDDAIGEDLAGGQVNVRNGVRELLLDCILWHESSEDDGGDDELKMMGYNVEDSPESGSDLLDRTLVLHALCPLITNMLQHSMAMRNQPKPLPNWWKGRELAILVVANIVNDLTELAAQASQPQKGKKKAAAVSGPAPFDLQSFVQDILLPDLSPTASPTHPLLRTQALNSTAQFGPVFLKAKETNLVAMALEALVVNMAPQPNLPEELLIRISAVNAFGSLCSTIDHSLLMHNNILTLALQNICHLIHAASTPNAKGEAVIEESALIKTLATLMMAINVDQPTTASAEPTLTPLLLGAWSANATASYIAEGVTDIFGRLLESSTATCISVQCKILPAIQSIFEQNRSNVAVTGTINAALDLLRSVLLSIEAHTRRMKEAAGVSAAVGAGESSAAAELIHPLIFSTLLPHVLDYILHTDDHDSIDSGTSSLAAYLRVDAAKVAGIQLPIVLPGSPAGTQPQQMTGLQVLCTIINQFLHPSLDDRVAHNVGALVVQVVFSLSGVLGEASIKELLKAVVARLHSSHYPPLDESLLLVFARLIHASGVESILSFVLSLGQIPVFEKKLIPQTKKDTDKYASTFKAELIPTTIDALPWLLKKWIDAQDDIQSRYPSKVLHLALAKLLTYLFTNTAGVDVLRNMECNGYVIVEKGPTKRHTRGHTAATNSSHEPQYTKVPLCTKLISLFLRQWREWNEKHQKALKREVRRAKKAAAREAGEEDDDDDYDSEDEDEFDDDDDYSDDGDDAFIAQMQNGKSPFAPASQFPDLNSKKLITLSDLLDSHAEMDEIDEESEEDVYPESITDPLNQIELGPFLQNFFKEFAQANNGQFINETAQWLDDADKKLLEAALKANPVAIASPKKK